MSFDVKTEQLLDAIANGAKYVVVDFTDTTFIDSTTLGVLVGGVKRLRTNDGHLSLVCSDRNITKIFEITGLDRVFTIYPTRDEAVAQLDAAGQPSAYSPRAAAAVTSLPRERTSPAASSCSRRSARPATR